MKRRPADIQQMILQGIEARDVIVRAIEGCRTDAALLGLTEVVAIVIVNAFMEKPAKAMEAASAFSASLSNMVEDVLMHRRPTQ